MAGAKKNSQREFLINVDGVEGNFATFSGGEVSSETTKAWDGGSKVPDVLAGVPMTSNIVVTRPYSAAAHEQIINALEKKVGSWRTTVTKQPTDTDYTPIGKPKSYPDCLLVKVTSPETDQTSAAAATWQLEFETPGAA